MHKSEQHSPIIIPHLLIYEIDIISTQSNPGNRVTRCIGLIWCSIIRKDFITWYAQSIPIDNIEIEKLHQLLSHDLLHHFVACIRSHPPEPSPDDMFIIESIQEVKEICFIAIRVIIDHYCDVASDETISADMANERYWQASFSANTAPPTVKPALKWWGFGCRRRLRSWFRSSDGSYRSTWSFQ